MMIHFITDQLQFSSIPVTDGDRSTWVCQYFIQDTKLQVTDQYQIYAEVPVLNGTANIVEFATVFCVSSEISSEMDPTSGQLSSSPINGWNITPSPGTHYACHYRQFFYRALISDAARGSLYFSVWARARSSNAGGQLTGQTGQGYMRILKITQGG